VQSVSAGPHVVVIGGGIAGVSAAYYLALANQNGTITLVEAEGQLAYHTTGRSAALLIENYGAGPIRPLTTASLDFFHRPPAGLVDHELLTARGILTIARSKDDHGELEAQIASGAQTATNPVVEIGLDRAAELAPHVRFGPQDRAMWEPQAYDIDVAGLHQAFVRGLRAEGGDIATSTRVDSARRSETGWTVATNQGPLHADWLVNAAGAWGDLVAESAGVAPVGLAPLKRTAFMVPSPFADSADYPCVAEIHHDWYIRPDGSQFMCSPADETPTPPSDVRADEIDIARTIDMINDATTLAIRSVSSSWAGLRTFGPDRSMVLGPDPDEPRFIWCVGQGGTGIQTAPGAGQLVADLVALGEPGPRLVAAGVQAAPLSPERLR